MPGKYGGNDATMRALLTGAAQVVGWQESRWQYLQLQALKGWHTAHLKDSDGDRSGQALSVDLGRFAVTDQGWSQISPATKVQEQAAGPGTHRCKGVTWVDVVDKAADRPLTFGVVHLVPSKHLGGATAKLYAKQVANIVAWVERQTKPVVLVGDFNGEPGDKALAPLVDVMDEVGGVPSLDGRAIDLIFTKGLGLSGVRAMPNGGTSDHRPVLGEVA